MSTIAVSRSTSFKLVLAEVRTHTWKAIAGCIMYHDTTASEALVSITLCQAMVILFVFIFDAWTSETYGHHESMTA